APCGVARNNSRLAGSTPLANRLRRIEPQRRLLLVRPVAAETIVSQKRTNSRFKEANALGGWLRGIRGRTKRNSEQPIQQARPAHVGLGGRMGRRSGGIEDYRVFSRQQQAAIGGRAARTPRYEISHPFRYSR